MAWCIGQHSEITSPLYCLRQASLVLGTGSAPTSRDNLSLRRDVARQCGNVLIVNLRVPLAELTHGRSGSEAPATPYSSSISQFLSPSFYSKGKSSGSISSPSGRDPEGRLPRKSTRSAVTSRLVCIWPSWPCQLRACSLPSTYTCFPLLKN